MWSVGFSPSGKFMATGSYENVARVWDLASGQCTVTLKVWEWGGVGGRGGKERLSEGTLREGSEQRAVHIHSQGVGEGGRVRRVSEGRLPEQSGL